MVSVAWQNKSGDPSKFVIHATAVSWRDKGVLIIGPSGSGKSSLALELMAFDADLIADDRVELKDHAEVLTLCAPQPIAGMIEARGFAVLAAQNVNHAKCELIVDLTEAAPGRLPDCVTTTFQGVECPYLRAKAMPSLASVILQFLKSGIATNES